MFVKMIKKIQYIIIRIIENYPSINTIILNNINYFKLFLPHDKDYLGLKILFSDKNIFNGVFIDVGGNTGSSILSFRSMGFQNEIYSFEPNLILFQKYLKKLKKNITKIKIYNNALSDKNGFLIFYIPFIKRESIHYFASFHKNYIKFSMKNTFPGKTFKLIKRKIKVNKLDNLNIKKKINLIKIDSEGHDLQVIKGARRTIKKNKPVLLIEYNQELYSKISSELGKNFRPYYYSISNNNFVAINSNNINKLCRFGHKDLLSVRNVFFIPISKLELLNC
jgi:FkbM family methyltransferase